MASSSCNAFLLPHSPAMIQRVILKSILHFLSCLGNSVSSLHYKINPYNRGSKIKEEEKKTGTKTLLGEAEHFIDTIREV